jgi:mono/diheme cytochrome c family protein
VRGILKDRSAGNGAENGAGNVLKGCSAKNVLKGCGFVSGHRFSNAISLPKSNSPLGAAASLAALAIALLLSTPSLAEPGAATFKAHCAACHGARGAADTMIGKNMNLRPLAADEVQLQSDDELFNKISKGKKNRMPPFENKLSKDQIHDLVKFIRSLKQ